MKKLFGSLAVCAALWSASPALANDVTGDRHSPYRNDQKEARAARVEATRPAEPASAPCACACLKAGAHDPGAHRAHDGR